MKDLTAITELVLGGMALCIGGTVAGIALQDHHDKKKYGESDNAVAEALKSSKDTIERCKKHDSEARCLISKLDDRISALEKENRPTHTASELRRQAAEDVYNHLRATILR